MEDLFKNAKYEFDLFGEKVDEIEKKGFLQKRFLIPPFSTFDTRQGYWQERKSQWLELTGNLSETRNNEYGTLGGANNNLLATINEGTSNFDPVLAEIICKWFCVPGGKILDPFGGEQTKGVVAKMLGYNYSAVEFRQDQVDLNNKTLNNLGFEDCYVCGDSNNISTLIKDRDFNLCFTSPPYYDLEVYSAEDMSALGTYEEFMQQYENIFKQCVDMLADNSFLVVKVADIRNKKSGEYRGFVADNIKMFQKLGLYFYNDIVLLNSIGTGAFRANTCMRTRKVVKLHQNILIFYKGDMRKINTIYPVIKEIEETYDYN